ncbi:DUF1398 family protein [Sphingosinicella sp. CPCC 101087]|uniref:DUF1398 family protein n=1 Tax=Sphingosinicella sp. CPCC 101087 TaxID=2497754 RepID=UPI00101D69EE|nr:DUF1398 family protein [Sphingosinicella sp. CPCC 101087]
MKGELVEVMESVCRGSEAGSMRFPEVVRLLDAAGVEQYHADLRRSERTYYLSDGHSHVLASALGHDSFGADFSEEGIRRALDQVQRGKIDYAEFCDRITTAGCTGYIVSIAGRRAIYLGRTGDLYVENFPPVL